jgi:hypothetical protein
MEQDESIVHVMHTEPGTKTVNQIVFVMHWTESERDIMFDRLRIARNGASQTSRRYSSANVVLFG